MPPRPIAFIDTETTSLPTGPCEPWEVALILRRPAQADAAYLWQLPVDKLAAADPMSLQIGGWNERRLPELIDDDGWSEPSRSDGIARRFALAGRNDKGAVIPVHQVHRLDMAAWAEQFVRLTWGAVVVGICPSFDTNHALGPLLRRYGQTPGYHYQPTDAEDVAAGALARWHDDHGTANDVGPVGPPWDSEQLAEAFGLDLAQYGEHTALGDAWWARDLYDAALGHDRQPRPGSTP